MAQVSEQEAGFHFRGQADNLDLPFTSASAAFYFSGQHLRAPPLFPLFVIGKLAFYERDGYPEFPYGGFQIPDGEWIR